MRKSKERIICILLVCVIIVTNLGGIINNKTSIEASEDYSKAINTEEISNKLVRFHVIANSDSIEDQNVKLKVRDAILNRLREPLEKCDTRAQSLLLLQKEKKDIENISDQILLGNGKHYIAKAMIGDFKFPIKSYGNVTLPPGKYRALRVVLGKGGGKNWWCVMFPPLCFIDISKGVTSAQTDKSLKKALSSKEITKITDYSYNKVKEKKSKYLKANIQLRFKGIDLLKNLFK